MKSEKRPEVASTVKFFDPKEPVGFVAGNLPHWRQEGACCFVTFRLADSMPQEKLRLWLAEREQWLREHPEPHSVEERMDFYERFPERFQEWLDAGYGSCVLADEGARKIVEATLRHFDGDRYVLHDYVVMPNHVHVLVSPLGDNRLSEIVKSWKTYSALQINRALGRSGSLWQKESFDHMVRNPDQMEKIRRYIQENPKALVEAAAVGATSGRVTGSEKRPEVASTFASPLSLKINEIYLSVQGESTWVGLPCVFVRLTACDLRCTYCDTEYAFFEGKKRLLTDIFADVQAFDCPLVEITGGEPLLQKNVLPLMTALCDAGRTVLIETSGAHDISRIDPRVHRIMDLKTPSSGECARNLFTNIAHLGPGDEVKFVLGSREDYEWARGQIREHGLAERVAAVLLSPVFGKIDPRDIVDWMLADKLPARFQLQMHKFIWEPRARGV